MIYDAFVNTGIFSPGIWDCKLTDTLPRRKDLWALKMTMLDQLGQIIGMMEIISQVIALFDTFSRCLLGANGTEVYIINCQTKPLNKLSSFSKSSKTLGVGKRTDKLFYKWLPLTEKCVQRKMTKVPRRNNILSNLTASFYVVSFQLEFSCYKEFWVSKSNV